MGLAAVTGVLWYVNFPEQIAFEPDTPASEVALAQVETFPDEDHEHVGAEEPVDYGSDFPTLAANLASRQVWSDQSRTDLPNSQRLGTFDPGCYGIYDVATVS